MDRIQDRLYLGNLKAAQDISSLKQNGITHILTVASGIEPLYPKDFTYKVINIADVTSSSLIRHLPGAIQFIKDGIQKGGVLVHCHAGVSRSSSCVIAFLMQDRGITFQQAFLLASQKRPIIFPNMGFQKQLVEFEQLLKVQHQMGSPVRVPKQMHLIQPINIPPGSSISKPNLLPASIKQIQKQIARSSSVPHSNENLTYELNIQDTEEENQLPTLDYDIRLGILAEKNKQQFQEALGNHYQIVKKKKFLKKLQAVERVEQDTLVLPKVNAQNDNLPQIETDDLLGQRKHSQQNVSSNKGGNLKNIFLCVGCNAPLFSNKDFTAHTAKELSLSCHDPTLIKCSSFQIIKKDWISNQTGTEFNSIHCYRKMCNKNIGFLSSKSEKCSCGEIVFANTCNILKQRVKLQQNQQPQLQVISDYTQISPIQMNSESSLSLSFKQKPITTTIQMQRAYNSIVVASPDKHFRKVSQKNETVTKNQFTKDYNYISASRKLEEIRMQSISSQRDVNLFAQTAHFNIQQLTENQIKRSHIRNNAKIVVHSQTQPNILEKKNSLEITNFLKGDQAVLYQKENGEGFRKKSQRIIINNAGPLRRIKL